MCADAWPNQPMKVTVPGTQTTTTLQNLRPAQVYHLRILAENRLGMSEPSQTVQINTLEEGNKVSFYISFRLIVALRDITFDILYIVPSGAPVDIRAEAKSSTELVVTWEPPPRETWNGNLLGYHVGYQEIPNEESNSVTPQSYIFKSVEVRPHFGGEAIIQGLSKYTTYSIIVQVVNTSFGNNIQN